MSIPPFIENAFLRLADTVFDRIPRSLPAPEKIQRCKIISHRGEHDNDSVQENTIAAFERAQRGGIWGLELDLRWTRDLEPVIFHDEDLYRLYGVRKSISALSLYDLNKQYPNVPTLSDVVSRFGKKCHLLIEVKMQPWINQARQVLRLMDVLAPLEPMENYHLITSHPEVMAPLRHIPRKAKVAIAMHFPGRLSKWVQQHNWGGFCGHYSLIGTKHIEAHHHRGQKIGTGYPRSRNSLFREIDRGIDWIFSNDAVRMQQRLDACRTDSNLNASI